MDESAKRTFDEYFSEIRASERAEASSAFAYPLVLSTLHMNLLANN